MKRSTKAIIAVPILLGVLAIGFTCFIFKVNNARKFYSSHYYRGTTINGIDVSNMSVSEVEEALLGDVKDYSLVVKFRNDKTETINSESIDYKYSLENNIKDWLPDTNKDIIKQVLWKLLINKPKYEYKTEVVSSYSEDLLNKCIENMPELNEANMIEPSASSIEFDGKFEFIPAENGTKLVLKDVQNAIKEAIDEKKNEIDINKLGLYAVAKENSESDEVLQDRVNTLNKYCGASITYLLPSGEKRVLNGEITKDWLSLDSDGNYFRDDTVWDNHVIEWFNQLTSDVNNQGTERKFNATGIGEITVSGGTYGYHINYDKELEALRNNLNNGDVVEREPIYDAWETSKENYGLGTTYVEADLTRQHIWFYQNGRVVLESDIVSGADTPDRRTPNGIYMFNDKESPSTLIGMKDGKVTYKTRVSYWMPFIGNAIGLHDATWQSAFGGTRWKDGYGSHGCINMPLEAAKQAYNIINFDEPVIIYYS